MTPRMLRSALRTLSMPKPAPLWPLSACRISARRLSSEGARPMDAVESLWLWNKGRGQQRS